MANDGTQKRQCKDCINNTKPDVPTLLSPTDGETDVVMPVTLDWADLGADDWGEVKCDPQLQENEYELFVGPSADNMALLTEVPEGGITEYAFTSSPNTTYYWYVSANNAVEKNDSAVWSFTTAGPSFSEITGTLYYDPNNTCDPSTPWNQGTDLTLTVRDTGDSATVPGSGPNAGEYALSVPAGTYNYLDLSGLPAGYICSTACGQECPTATSVTVPSVNQNFYLTQAREAWWQLEMPLQL
ncbi:MAG: hypothetical protein ACOYZ8_11555 [Chloroflexota bacterium]